VVVVVYKSHIEAETAVKEMLQAEFNAKKLSIIGYNFYTDEDLAGCYNAENRAKLRGKEGAFWSGVWVLLGSAFLFVPCFGSLLVAGPLVSHIVEALQGGVVVGGLTALGTGLHSLGIPKDSIPRYETEVKAGKFIMVAQGCADETAQTEKLRNTNPESFELQQPVLTLFFKNASHRELPHFSVCHSG